MYDLAIIGGGPAGYSAAFEAARYHMSAVLFEQGNLGGTCLNRGCVPTKFLSHVARKYYEAKNPDDGIRFQSLSIDFCETRARMGTVISSLRAGLSESLKKSGIEIVYGNAAVRGSGIIVCNGQEYPVKNLIICTGSVYQEPLADGAKTGDDILEMDQIPEKLHILGGGTVAVEFAEIFRMLGSDVTISIRGDRILRKWDKEIAVGLTQSMKKKGIMINKGCDLSSLAFSEDETVLSATGRKARLPEYENGLFEIGPGGGIVVDENGRTGTKGIFAAGDVTEGSVQLAHTAMEQGRQIVRFIAKGTAPEKQTVIRCIYPDQEAASAGITEAEGLEQGISFVTAKQPMFANARTLISTAERGFIKILAAKEDGRILGAQLLCEHAGELIAELAVAIDQGLTVPELLQTVRPHPSYCESVQDVLRTLEDKLNEV